MSPRELLRAEQDALVPVWSSAFETEGAALQCVRTALCYFLRELECLSDEDRRVVYRGAISRMADFTPDELTVLGCTPADRYNDASRRIVDASEPAGRALCDALCAYFRQIERAFPDERKYITRRGAVELAQELLQF